MKVVAAMIPSVLCDLDGVLIHHGSDYAPLRGAVEAVRRWHENGFVVVVVTARNEVDRSRLEELFGPLHAVVVGLGSGPRYLVNDRKPYLPGADMAIGVNVERDAAFEADV